MSTLVAETSQAAAASLREGAFGNAVALAFGRAGAKIVACDLNAVGVAERVREFAALGVDARPCAGDLTQPDIATLAVEMALRHFGQLDVVVNVAGGLTTYGPLERLTVTDFDRETFASAEGVARGASASGTGWRRSSCDRSSWC